MAFMLTLAVAAQKGGVGKTSAAVNLAFDFAERGLETLLIDLDPQGHCAAFLGLERDHGSFEALMRHSQRLMGPRAYRPLEQFVRSEVRAHLSLLSGSPHLAQAELVLAGDDGREHILSKRLREVSNHYALCVLDLGPSVSLLSTLGLMSAQAVLVPVTPGAGPESGYLELASRLEALRESLGLEVRLMAFANMTAPRERESVKLLEFIDSLEHPGPGVRRTVRLSEAVRMGQTIFEYDPDGGGAEDYRILAQWTLEQLEEVARDRKNP